MKHAFRYYGRYVATCALLASPLACVYSQSNRLTRTRLYDGTEGFAQVLSTVPQGSEIVAEISVRPTAVATAERSLNHLRRRANLMGCDGIASVQNEGSDTWSALCLVGVDKTQVRTVPEPGPNSPVSLLRSKAEARGQDGAALTHLLDSLGSRTPDEQRFAIEWYLGEYPQAPFENEVRALLNR